ncbi:MAG: hypothetical protein ACWA5A_07485 [Marinibacterium sp.]
MLLAPVTNSLGPAGLRPALIAGPHPVETAYKVVMGDPGHEARCPQRYLIFGTLHPREARRLALFAVAALTLPNVAFSAITNHQLWMYYIELVVELCR